MRAETAANQFDVTVEHSCLTVDGADEGADASADYAHAQFFFVHTLYYMSDLTNGCARGRNPWL
jgi:hypothetical protein